MTTLAAAQTTQSLDAPQKIPQSQGLHQDPQGSALKDIRLRERPGRTGLPIPRFVSLAAAETNLRKGPGLRYPIDWVYQRRYLPVEVIDEFENWRKIRDLYGASGWVHQSMVSGRRSAIVIAPDLLLRGDPTPKAKAIARIEKGAIGELEMCTGAWCRIDFHGYTGWLERSKLFGLYESEVLR